MNALNEAIDIMGGQTAMAEHLGTTVQVVNNWLRRGSVPPNYAPIIERATDGRVMADTLCPHVPWHVIRNGRAA